MARKPKQIEGVYERTPGSGVWYYRYSVNGKRVRKSFGRDRAAAVAYAEKTRTVQRSGEGYVPDTARRHTRTLPEMQVVGGIVTVGELCDDYLRHIISLPPGKMKDQVNPVRRVGQVRAQFGDLPADGLRPYQILQWLQSLTKHTPGHRNKAKGKPTAVKIAPATQHRLKVTVSAIFKLALFLEKVTFNPASSVPAFQASKLRDRPLTHEEEDRLRAVLLAEIDGCGANNKQQKKRVIHRICELDVALGTGLRQGEQYGMKWADVDWDDQTITVRDTKNGTDHTVDMNRDVLNAMQTLKALDLDLPGSQPDCVFQIGEPKKWWNAALKKARIEGLRWHDLRHTFATRYAQLEGATFADVRDACNHKSVSTTNRYVHSDRANRKRLIAGLVRTKV